jgi:hypothetical protein
VFADLGDCFSPAVGVHAEEFFQIFVGDVDAGGVEGVVRGEIADGGLFGCVVSSISLKHGSLKASLPMSRISVGCQLCRGHRKQTRLDSYGMTSSNQVNRA